MKNLGALALSFLLLNSCVEREIEAYDNLTQAEQDEIRQRGEALCLERSGPTFENFKTLSNEVFLSTGYDRGAGFIAEFSGGTISKKLDVKIWKRTANELYFYISSENSDDYFLKVSKAENIAMVDALKAAYCKRPEIYISSLSDNTLTMTNEYILPKDLDTEKYKDSYQMPFNSLVAFANYRITRTRGRFNADNEQIDTTVKYESKMTGKAYTFSSTNPSSAEYSQRFCSIDSNGGYLFPKERGLEGFKNTCTDTTPPAGWDLSI